MRRGGSCTLRHAAGFDDDDRFDPCGGSRGRHEFAGVLDGFDIEQDSSGLTVEREMVKQIGDVDVELVANRNDSRKADRALRRPIHHAGGNGTRLGNQRQISRTRHVRGKTRIEVRARHHDAKTIGSDQPHAIFLRGAFGGLRQRPRAVAKPGGDNQRARRAQLARLIDQARDCRGRRSNHNEFRHKRQFVEVAYRGNPVDLAITRIHQPEFACEFCLVNIPQNGPSDGSLARAGPDQCKRTRRKQIFQTVC